MLSGVLVLGLWVYSYTSITTLSNEGAREKEVAITSIRGKVVIQSLGSDDRWPGLSGWTFSLAEPTAGHIAEFERLTSARTFGWVHWGHSRGRYLAVTVPHWGLLALCLVIPGLRWLKGRRARSSGRGYEVIQAPAR